MGNRDPTRQSHIDYRPYSLRPHHLLSIAAIALLLLGLIQIGLQTLPHASPATFTSDVAVQSGSLSRRHPKRQSIVLDNDTIQVSSLALTAEQVSNLASSLVSSRVAPSATSVLPTSAIHSISPPSPSSIPNVGAAPPASYVPTVKVITPTPIIEAPPALAVITSPLNAPNSVPALISPAIDGTSLSSVHTVGFAPPSSYVDTARALTNTPSPVSPLFDNGGVISTARDPLPAGSPDTIVNANTRAGSLQAEGTLSATTGRPLLPDAPASTDRLGEISIARANTIRTSGAVVLQVVMTNQVTTIVSGPSGSKTEVIEMISTRTSTKDFPTTPSLSGVDSNVLATHPTSSGGEIITLTWPLWKVFVSGYLPLLIAVIYRILWADIYANVKLHEPFTQLARPEGASISEVGSLYYLSTSLVPEQIISLMKSHWLMFLASATYVFVAVLSPLASEILFLDTRYDCPHPDPRNAANPCWPPQLSINPLVARLAQAVLGIVACLTCGLIWFLGSRTSRLREDPSTIAGAASLMQSPQVLEDFRHIDSRASLEDMQRVLASRLYTITDCRNEIGTCTSELVSLRNQPGDDSISQHVPGQQNPPNPIVTWCRLNVDLLLDLWLLCFLIAALIVVTTYVHISDDSSFNRFFNSNTFGPRFLMSSVGTIIALNFRRLEREAHTIAPYRSLYRRTCTAESTLLLKRPASPWIACPYMLSHRHAIPAAIAFAAMLAEVLIIALAGVPYSPGQVFMELLVCGYLSIAILSSMAAAIIALLIWRRGCPALSRWPDTLLAALSYATDLGRSCDNDHREVEPDGNAQGYRFKLINDDLRCCKRWTIMREATS